MKKLLLAAMFLGASLFLSACKITLNGEEIRLGNPGNDSMRADEDNLDSAEKKPDDTTALVDKNEEEIKDDFQNDEKLEKTIDSCGNDLTAIYQILPEQFHIPDCATIHIDGSDYIEGGGKWYHSFHYTADNFSSQSVYNLTINYFTTLGYEITEDRVEDNFHFALLTANLGAYEFLWDTRDIGTEDGDHSVVGWQLIIDLE